MKKFTIVMLIASLVLTSVFANGTEEKKQEGPIELTWWSNIAKPGSVYAELVEKFNASQNDYHLTFVTMGSADEIIAKLQSISDFSELPDMFSNGNEQTAYFAQSDFVTPIYEVAAKNGGWDYSDTFAHLKKAYSTLDGKLVGYPMGNSFSIVWYNKDIFAAAGVDPSSLRSAQDIPEICQKIVDGGFAKNGIAFHKYGGMLNIALAIQGAPSFDNNNGYGGEVTKCLYMEGDTNKAIYNMLAAYQELYSHEGWALPLGTNVDSEVIPAFANGTLAMFRGTISYLGRILKAGMDKDKIGIINMYGCDDDTRSTGYPCAGTGSYICNTGDKAKQRGALEFIKFCAQPENTVTVAKATGYAPVTTTAAKAADYQAWIADTCPAMQNVIDAMTNGDDKSGFPYVEISNELLTPNTVMFETVTTDKNADINKAIKTCYESIQEALELHNASK